MPVRVADQRIKDHHVAERLIELVAHLLQFGGDLGKFLLRKASVDRHEGVVDICEKFAGAAQRAFPFCQLVADVVQPHCFGDLGCVKLGIRLVAGVRRAGTAALVEQDLSADAPPALAQVSVGGELRRRRKRARPHTAEPCPSDQRQRLVETVLKEVVVLEIPLELLRNDPIAVVHGKPHAQLDDAEDVVVVQPVNGKNLVHKFTVTGDDAGLQPVEQTFVGQAEPQGKQTALLFRYFQNRTDKTVQPLRLQVEGEQLRIVLFQDEFHCLHLIFFCSNTFLPWENDTQINDNISCKIEKSIEKQRRHQIRIGACVAGCYLVLGIRRIACMHSIIVLDSTFPFFTSFKIILR